MGAQFHSRKEETVRCQRDKETQRDRDRETTTGCRTSAESNVVSEYKAGDAGRRVNVPGFTVQH